jgi:hypothetical protein
MLIVELLRETIERDRFARSPRLKQLRGILAKLSAEAAPVTPYPAPKLLDEQSMGLAAIIYLTDGMTGSTRFVLNRGCSALQRGSD